MDSQLIRFVHSHTNVNTLSPLCWAYIGDAVYELFIRSLAVASGGTMDRIHRRVVQRVAAVDQAAVANSILEGLSADERTIMRRGRNSKGNVPRSTDPTTYRHSTGFEALLGYLYLTGEHDRLWEILQLAAGNENGLCD